MIGPVSPERLWAEAGQQEDNGNEDDKQSEDEGAYEGQPAKVKVCCEGPNERDIEDHMATHVPFRSWCPFCIVGKAAFDPTLPKC